MTSTPTAPVTPQGVRDGDMAALAGLARRRSGPVYDYMRHACGSSSAMDATAEAFARFRGAVVAAEDPAALDPDQLLLSCTRHASAAFAPITGPRPECPSTPFLLIGRLEGSNPVSEEARLTKHLALCQFCADRAEAFAEGERAFRAPHPEVPDGVVVERVIAALLSAAPNLAADEPVAVVDEPVAVTDEPVAVTDEPVAVTDEPVAVVDEPDAVADAPVEPEYPTIPAPGSTPEFEDEVHDALRSEDDEDFEYVVLGEPQEDDEPAPSVSPAVAAERDVVPRVVVPTAIVAGAVMLSMAVAGIFGGTSPAPARGQSGLPGPTPPAQPPPADEQTRVRAAREAREALTRIEERERATAVAAARERQLEEERDRTGPEDSGTAEPPRPTQDQPAPTPTPRPSTDDDTTTPPRDDDSSLETVEPEGPSDSTAPEAPVFEAGQPSG